MNDHLDSRIAATLDGLDIGSVAFSVEAEGSRWEPLQALRPYGPPLHPSDFSVVTVHDPSRNRMRLSWRRTFLEPLTATVEFAEIVVDNQGYISDSDIALAPKPARPMESDRLGAVRRQQYLLYPQLLVGEALRRQKTTGIQAIRSVGREKLNGVPHEIIEIDAFPRPVCLFVNLESHELSQLATQENDFPCGDVDIIVTFSDWRREGALAFPYLVALSWDGTVLHRERRRRIEINPRLEPDIFVLPETLPFDAELYNRGVMNAQWMQRALAMGAPIILGAGDVVPVQLGPDVVTIGGGIHHSMAIALEAGLVVVDPPQHEERSLAVIKAVTAQWPGKPITHCILTHHHHDHSGGIRAYAAIGAELIIAQGDREFISRCLERPHTISPDTLAGAKVRPVIHTVGDEHFSLGEGRVQIHRISSPHSAEDLVVYVTSLKLLFNADLFNPGLVRHEGAAPPHWLAYSKDFRKQIEALGLDIELLLGAHGVPEGGPYQELIDFTK